MINDNQSSCEAIQEFGKQKAEELIHHFNGKTRSHVTSFLVNLMRIVDAQSRIMLRGDGQEIKAKGQKKRL